VPLAYVLDLAGAQPQAKYVVFFSHQPQMWESIDVAEAVHPQTLITYGMNGGDLPIPHGAPLRLRVPRQLGYKNVKHISRITVTDNLKNIRNGLGSGAMDVGLSWYAGI
jgi:DMSO/TMAO reductase YedYZ molybdopterin-dependent catalytic subunit